MIDKDEMVFTKLSSINFLQLTIKTVQAGTGETVDKVKGSDGLKEVKGKSKAAWSTMVARYEKDVAWMRRPEVKEVRFLVPFLDNSALLVLYHMVLPTE